jgi:hypothetical protein
MSRNLRNGREYKCREFSLAIMSRLAAIDRFLALNIDVIAKTCILLAITLIHRYFITVYRNHRSL